MGTEYLSEAEREALHAFLAAGPVATGTTHPGYVVKPPAAIGAAQTVAERAPDDAIPLLLLDMLGITGRDGPDDGRWSVYSFGRPSKREVRSA
jgi:hypothetical protein